MWVLYNSPIYSPALQCGHMYSNSSYEVEIKHIVVNNIYSAGRVKQLREATEDLCLANVHHF